MTCKDEPTGWEPLTQGGFKYVIHSLDGLDPTFPIVGEVVTENRQIVPTQWSRLSGTSRTHGLSYSLVPITPSVTIPPFVLQAGVDTWTKVRGVGLTSGERGALHAAIKEAVITDRKRMLDRMDRMERPAPDWVYQAAIDDMERNRPCPNIRSAVNSALIAYDKYLRG